MIQKAQEIVEATPAWANWLIVTGSAAASWLAPIASLVAIGWGCIQGYIAIQKYRHWKRTKDK